MARLFKTLSLAPRSIRNKLSVVFALMAVIPMLVCGYFIIYYIFPTVKTTGDVSLIFVITLFLVLLGFYLAKKIIYPIIQITAHAKGIVEGRLDQALDVNREDEIGELSGSLNRLSSRLKENMSELHSYGEKIKQINMEINKKVFALSSLLQIGNLITSSTNLDEIFNLIIKKLSQLETGGQAFLMLLDKQTGRLRLVSQVNIDAEEALEVQIKIGQGALGRILESLHPLIVDTKNGPAKHDENLHKLLPAKNIAILPVGSYGQAIGLLGTGNNLEEFSFSDDEIELINVFAKQVSVAIENDMLLHKTEELTVTDELTGLYNESYIRSRLDEEIKRAISYQRPCSLIIFEIANFEQYRTASGDIVVEKTLKKIARTLKESTSEVDKVARFSNHQFAAVLPEKNKGQSQSLAKHIMQEIERFALTQEKNKVALTVHTGISSTPIDGTTSLELINKALAVAGAINDR